MNVDVVLSSCTSYTTPDEIPLQLPRSQVVGVQEKLSHISCKAPSTFIITLRPFAFKSESYLHENLKVYIVSFYTLLVQRRQLLSIDNRGNLREILTVYIYDISDHVGTIAYSSH